MKLMSDDFKVVVRVATSEDGPRIGELVAQEPEFAKIPRIAELDWSVVQTWAVAHDDQGKILACVQIGFGKPISHLEILAVDQSLDDALKKLVVEEIMVQTNEGLRKQGAEMVSGMAMFTSRRYTEFRDDIAEAVLAMRSSTIH
jgi:N-acetylglutamate synthase-like GNAT family acetyltransferase